ncbi:hypothetical protein O181_021195 [Austropuccinia psidii MF-1]|uniref:Uncharacterized protein n=1 Tax=Austropuccinia psidii MF-1 TaxID=1389203 RepID=A0A9Q3GWV2_9BASI|nr:hypothetical protein [Austropuccinia psidii MF-1]
MTSLEVPNSLSPPLLSPRPSSFKYRSHKPKSLIVRTDLALNKRPNIVLIADALGDLLLPTATELSLAISAHLPLPSDEPQTVKLHETTQKSSMVKESAIMDSDSERFFGDLFMLSTLPDLSLTLRNPLTIQVGEHQDAHSTTIPQRPTLVKASTTARLNGKSAPFQDADFVSSLHLAARVKKPPMPEAPKVEEDVSKEKDTLKIVNSSKENSNAILQRPSLKEKRSSHLFGSEERIDWQETSDSTKKDLRRPKSLDLVNILRSQFGLSGVTTPTTVSIEKLSDLLAKPPSPPAATPLKKKPSRPQSVFFNISKLSKHRNKDPSPRRPSTEIKTLPRIRGGFFQSSPFLFFGYQKKRN